MLRIGSSFKNLTVLSLHAGYPIATLTEMIINPHNLSIEAFYTANQSKSDKIRSALLIQDIREASGNRVIIDHADDIRPVEDLIRLQEMIAINYQLIGKKVMTLSKHNLGKVEEFVANDDDFKIEKLHVGKPGLLGLKNSKLIINRSQVVSMNDDTIIVKDGTEKIAAAKPSLVASPAS